MSLPPRNPDDPAGAGAPGSVAVAALILATLTLAAVVAAGVDRAPLGVLEHGVDAWVEFGGRLHAWGANAVGALRLGLLLTGLAAFGAGLQGTPHSRALRGFAALCLGWLAQLELSEGHTFAALAGYAVALAIYFGSAPRLADVPTPSRRAESVLAIAALAVFVALGAHEIELRPDVFLDERAYASAARMAVGLEPPGPIIDGLYHYERFVAQPIPFSIHASAFAALPDHVQTLRATSLALGVATLWLAWAGMRRSFDSASAGAMLALAAASPLFLAYSRPGFYIAATTLHAVACFVALLRFRERWNPGWAAALGALLGSSVYFYQLSWFVPVLAGLAGLCWPDLWRRPQGVRVFGTAAMAAVVVALPWFALPNAGVQQLMEQSYLRTVEVDADTAQQLVDLLSPPRLSYLDATQQFREIASATGAGRTPSVVWSRTGSRAVIHLLGTPASLEPLHSALSDASWISLRGQPGPATVGDRALGMTSLLFARAGWEEHQRLVDRAVLNPLLAPMILFGLVVAVRNWRNPKLRALAVWLVAAALLPAQVAGELPRRVALMEPLQHLLAAVAFMAVLPPVGTRARGIALALGMAGVVASAALGAHLAARHWTLTVRESQPELIAGEALRVDTVLASRVRPRLAASLRKRIGSERNVVLYPPIQPITTGFALRETCARVLPLSWVVPDADAEVLRKALSTRFEFETAGDAAFEIVRVNERLAGGCANQPPQRLK